MGLVGRDERDTVRATVAGLLFCSHTPEEWLPNACITATHYRGTGRASGQLDTQTIIGPLNRQIAEAVAFAGAQHARRSLQKPGPHGFATVQRSGPV